MTRQDKIKSAMTTTQLITFLKTLTNNLFLVCWALGHITFTSNHSVLEFHKVFGVEMSFSVIFLQTEWDLDKNLGLSSQKIYIIMILDQQATKHQIPTSKIYTQYYVIPT